MDAIKSWAVTVCLAALAAGVAGIVAPSGKLEKTYKFAVSLFFLCCMVTPLFGLRSVALPEISQSAAAGISDADGFQNDVAEQTKTLAEQNLTAAVQSCCQTAGATPLSVSVRLKSSGSALSLSCVTVTLRASQMNRQDAVSSAIRAQMGVTPTIRKGSG